MFKISFFGGNTLKLSVCHAGIWQSITQHGLFTVLALTLYLIQSILPFDIYALL